MRNMEAIYLDHQATSTMDERVFAAMVPYLSRTIGNPHASDHALGWKSAKAVGDASERVARLVGADPDEIIFTSGATEANNLGLLGLARRAVGTRRNRVLISSIEHSCVLSIARVMQQHLGYKVEVVPVDSSGRIISDALAAMLADDVLVLSVMAVNNEIGTVQDIEAISNAARQHGVFFHCDAAQAPCGMDMRRVADLADFVALSGQKMNGPQGAGALCVRRHLQERLEPLTYGGGQQGGLRPGTVPVALCVGLGVAADLLNPGDAERERTNVALKRDNFVLKLAQLRWSTVLNGPSIEQRHPGNANIRFCGFDGRDVLAALQPRVAASTGSACASGISGPSHVLKAIGLTTDDAEASIRFSIGRQTTEMELNEAVELIDGALERIASRDRSAGISSGSRRDDAASRTSNSSVRWW